MGAEVEREEEGPVEVMESRLRDGTGGLCLREMARSMEGSVKIEGISMCISQEDTRVQSHLRLLEKDR